MIDLGKSEEVTAVLKLVLIFLLWEEAISIFQLAYLKRGAFSGSHDGRTFFLTLQSIKNSFRQGVRHC